jgi:hypothetical protein
MRRPHLLVIILVIISPFFAGCPKKRQQPPIVHPPPVATPTPSPSPIVEPSPEPSPTATPSPSPTASPTPPAQPTPTPFPTPQIDAASYIPARKPGATVRLRGEEGEDYAAKIQAVMDNAADVGLVVLGPGSVKRSIIANTHVFFETTPQAPFACDQTEPHPRFRAYPLSDVGCVLMADGVHVSGNFQPPQGLLDYFAKGTARLGFRDPYFEKLAALTDDEIHGNASTVLEPEFSLGPGNPGIIVFHALSDIEGNPHRGKAQNLAVTGIVIQGRQRKDYDGGVRQAIGFGNCHRCTAQRNFLRDTGSIGIQAGGTSDEGNFSKDVVFTLNINSGGAAAHIAAVNGDNIYGYHNYSRRPGRKGWGGGVSAFDMETNSHSDHSNEVWVYNNLADYEGGAFDGVGSAFLAQDPYTGPNRGTVHMVNNVAIGGRADTVHRYMSNGLYAVGLLRPQLINNYVFRTGQNAIQMYNTDGGLIQDNDFHHTGGGGQFTIHFFGVQRTTVRRSNFRTAEGVPINVQAGFVETDGSCGNVYEDNTVDGREYVEKSKPCPSAAPRSAPQQRKFVSGSSWRGFTGTKLRELPR